MLCFILVLFGFLLSMIGSAVAQSCSFSVTNVTFGYVDTLSGAAIDTSGTVNITCTAGSTSLGIKVQRVMTDNVLNAEGNGACSQGLSVRQHALAA